MAVRILHLHSTFSLGGKEARSVRLINAFGDLAEHTIISSVPGSLSARDAIDRSIKIDFPKAPPLAGLPSPLKLWRLARFMRQYDLVLTYNWGAFDAVMARRLFASLMRLPPLIHHEDGFNEDEVARLKNRRNLYRRLGLSAAYKLVVPSRTLAIIAQKSWAQPESIIEIIPNGVDLARFSRRQVDGVIPKLPPPAANEITVGAVAGLRPVKNLPRLVRAFAGLKTKNARLVIVGEGPECEHVVAEARKCGVADRLYLPGFLANPASFLGHFDIFALSSDTEQLPISVIEAMAAGLPVVATAVGDVPFMVSEENRPLIVHPSDEAAFAAALDALAERPDLRRGIGQANRLRAEADFDEERMIARYSKLYGKAIGKPYAFTAG